MIADRGLCRKSFWEAYAMEQVYGRCCGVDIHKKLIVACFRQGRKQEIREFGATTRELLQMTEEAVKKLQWKVQCHIGSRCTTFWSLRISAQWL